MRNVRKGFTLAEMLVVLGIVIIFLALAIPTVRTLTGSTSIDMTQNNLSAYLVGVREQAVAAQDVRGVLFFCDKTSDRIMAIVVQAATVQDSNLNILLLDAVPQRDPLPLPTGVRLQTIFSGINPTNSAAGTDDRYMGFNLLSGSFQPPKSPGIAIGGVILFDGNGRLVSRAYGFQMKAANGGYSNLYYAINFPGAPDVYVNATNTNAPQSMAFIPGYTGTTPPPNNINVMSQVALILFDYDAFKSQGFTDQDADMQSPNQSYTSAWPVGTAGVDGDGTHSEQQEENWLDSNSTPLLVNRYDGTLISAK